MQPSLFNLQPLAAATAPTMPATPAPRPQVSMNTSPAPLSPYAALLAALPALTGSDATFAGDLLAGYRRYGSWTPRQSPHVDRLIARANTPAPASSDNAVNVGDFTAVIDLFRRAQVHLKYPKIRLMCGSDPVILSIAGAASKAPGTVNVTGEGSYPNRAWYGRVTPDGRWEPSQRANADSIGELLRQLATDPAGTAAMYGKLTGNCCFCQRELTDARSVTAGYGPVCADHYGLASQWANAVKVLDLPEASVQGQLAGVLA